MLRPGVGVVALGCSLLLAACRSAPEPPQEKPVQPPVTTVEPGPATSEPAGTTAGAPTAGATAGAQAAGWRPAKCSEYTFTPKGCHGSPENPNCVDTFKLLPNGRADKQFDDIMTVGTYESSGNSVTIRIPEMKYSETFTVEQDGEVLVGPRGERYQRSDCP